MKVTITKMEKKGLNKDQIKDILNIKEEAYSKARSQRRSYEIEDLPAKLDYILKGGNVTDFILAKIFDDIFRLNNMEVLSFEINKKIELIKGFPSFIKYIEMKKLSDQIESLNLKKDTLIAECSNIDEQIKLIRSQIESMGKAVGSKTIADGKKILSKIPTFILGENVKFIRTNKNGIIQGRIKFGKRYGFKKGDIVDIADENGITRYEITNDKSIDCIQCFKPIRKILEKRYEDEEKNR